MTTHEKTPLSDRFFGPVLGPKLMYILAFYFWVDYLAGLQADGGYIHAFEEHDRPIVSVCAAECRM